MECAKVRENLSAYVDNMLSAAERTAVEEHHRSCHECAAALADLRKTLEHIKGLESVEPPPWLAQKIMARVRAEDWPRQNLFRRLFYPLHVKLPIEAVATVLIVGLALYIYRDIGPEMKLTGTPAKESTPQVTRREIIREDKIGPFKGREEKNAPEEITTATEKPAEEPTVAKEAGEKADRQVRSRAQETRKKEEAKAPAPVKSFEQTPATGMVAKDEAQQETRAAAPEAKLSHLEEQVRKALSLTVLVKDPETAVRDIEKTLKELDGREIRTESVDGRKVVTATMTVGKVHQLFEKLKFIGEVKEKELDVKGREGDVMLRIEVTKKL